MTTPIFIASTPVCIGGEPESLEAAKAPIATGGVMKEIIAQYNMNRWTAIGFIPVSTSAGAKMMAREAQSQENETRDTQRGTNEKKDDFLELFAHPFGHPF